MTTRTRAIPKTGAKVSLDDGIDRDTWCTPRGLARAIGRVDLDPCSNERSHVLADRTFRLDRGEDGLVLARFVTKNTRTFVNPPYSHGNVIRWVRAYRRTRFTFLVRFDVSTDWWAELFPFVAVFATPRERVAFEPPPGAEALGSPFPHVLAYAREEDVSTAIRSRCYVLRR